MADFETGPRSLNPDEKQQVLQVFRTHVLTPNGGFDHRIGTFPMTDRFGVRTGDLNFDRVTLFNRVVLGKDPAKWRLEQAQYLWMQSIERRSLREKLELDDMRFIDNDNSALVDVTSSGLVRLKSVNPKLATTIPETLYETAFFLAQQRVDPGIDPNTLFIEVHPDFIEQRLLLLRFKQLREGVTSPDFVLIDRMRNLVPRKIFTVRSLLETSS